MQMELPLYEAFKAIFTEPDEKTYENLTDNELTFLALELQNKALRQRALYEEHDSDLWDKMTKIANELEKRNI